MTKSGSDSLDVPGASSCKIAVWVIPILLVCLGIALRVYHLGDESVWYDEYIKVGYLDAPDLSSYLAQFRVWNPDSAPLYALLLYAWSRVFGTSILAARMMSILLSVASIPILFGLTRRLLGTRAAALAAFLAAVSPLHIWFGQSIIAYALMEPLAVGSMYGLVRAVQDGGKRWWALNLACNLLLSCTHLFVVFFLVPEGLYLLLAMPRRWSRLFPWGFFHGAVLGAIFVFWLLPTVAVVPGAEYDGDFALPGAYECLVNAFGHDAVMESLEFPLSEETWAWVPAESPEAWFARHSWFDLAVMAFSAGSLLWICWISLRDWLRRGQSEAAPIGLIEGRLFLFLAALLPPLEIIFLSFVWRPCLQPRFVIYSSLALYAVIGGALASVRPRFVRAAAIAVLTLVYGYQLSLMLPAVSRTDWRGAASYIAEHGSPDDLVIVRGYPPLAASIFKTNAPRDIGHVEGVYAVDDAMSQGAAYLIGTGGETPQTERRAWFVNEVTVPDEYTLREMFDQCFPEGTFEKVSGWFPGGMHGVLVYGIRCAPGADSALASYAFPLPLNQVYSDARQTLEGHLDIAAMDKQVFFPLCCHLSIPYPLSPLQSAIMGIVLVEKGQADLASLAAERALRLEPDLGYGHMALAMARGASGDAEGAIEAFEAGMKVDSACIPVYAPFFRALYGAHDREDALRELERLSYGGWFPYVAFSKLAGTED